MPETSFCFRCTPACASVMFASLTYRSALPAMTCSCACTRPRKNSILGYPTGLWHACAHEAKQGSHIFLVGKSMNIRTVTEQWRRRLKKIFTLAGTFEERPHPHRFRSTFARVLLE